MRLLLLLAVCAALSVDASPRSQVAKRQFAKANPCPANGKRSVSCPGYVIDHVIPLCAGGPDAAANMQWQTVKAAAAKDRREIAYCACLRAKKSNCKFIP